ncbi:hypothetical protein TPHA_0I01040 [Tetrapisispora phaffii CBS 4417]|uniref:MICOS complex subunit MIC60 n=1 Tax=Tetrapisispora phaffii (strain ATCC 24235 / CBS 4417 / NBRC 1672 / NRRL Y-8282 / UCD 70-5) TaxID=1071381 RepID=G8BXI2_TETPH|nr:hypothetical protein TPHA_0I01040 [Tetrapisispora phaffii CBS 4417]CCE64610.1 hypothetical protein TPHA_0I01040 [Tetrapisispora phaffii CBS 4417]
MLRSGLALHAGRRLLTTYGPAIAKKSGTLKKIMFRTVIGTAVVYGGGVALSDRNDQFAEYFTAYVPFAEPLLDKYETYKYLGSKNKTASYSSSGLREKINDIIYGSNDKRFEETSDSAPPLVINEVVELVPIELLDLELIQLDESITEPKFFKLVEDLNSTIKTIVDQNIKLTKPQIQSIINYYTALRETIHIYNNELQQNIDSFVIERVNQSLADLNAEFNEKIQAKETELTTSFINEFNVLKDNLEQRHAAELSTELRASEQTLSAKHANEVTLLSITQVEEFTKIIKEKVDKERDRRLGKLGELNKEVETLSTSVEKVNKLLLKKEATTQITLLLTSIKQKLLEPATPDNGISIKKELDKLTVLSSILCGANTNTACECPSKCKPTCKCNGCLKKKNLFSITVNELNKIVKDKNILSNEQLLNRWSLLEKDFKTSSLLPQNPGILGHMSAKIFSMLLFTKRGVSTDGTELDSIYANINENIRLSKLDIALTDAVSLQGWPHIVCQDWIEDAKLKLEVESLVDVLDSEVRTM